MARVAGASLIGFIVLVSAPAAQTAEFQPSLGVTLGYGGVARTGCTGLERNCGFFTDTGALGRLTASLTTAVDTGDSFRLELFGLGLLSLGLRASGSAIPKSDSNAGVSTLLAIARFGSADGSVRLEFGTGGAYAWAHSPNGDPSYRTYDDGFGSAGAFVVGVQLTDAVTMIVPVEVAGGLSLWSSLGVGLEWTP